MCMAVSTNEQNGHLTKASAVQALDSVVIRLSQTIYEHLENILPTLSSTFC
jgi:hypothetical protein